MATGGSEIGDIGNDETTSHQTSLAITAVQLVWFLIGYYGDDSVRAKLLKIFSKIESTHYRSILQTINTQGLENSTNDKYIFEKNLDLFKSFRKKVCFLFVLSARSLTESRLKTISLYQKFLGAEFEKRVIFIFTGFKRRAGALESFDEFISTAPQLLATILHKCNKRYFSYDFDDNSEKQLKALYDVACDIHKRHGCLNIDHLNIDRVNELLELRQELFEFRQELSESRQELSESRQELLELRQRVSQLERKIEKQEKFIENMRVQNTSTVSDPGPVVQLH